VSASHCNKTKSLVTESGCISSRIACVWYRTHCECFPSLEEGFLKQSVVSGRGEMVDRPTVSMDRTFTVVCAWHDTSAMSRLL
jgi:hypothetical protein